MPIAAGTHVGAYQVVRLLGMGGMGEVYLALDTRLDRRVALKLLPPDVAGDPLRRARFEREARLAAALQHPYVCTIHEVGEADGRPFIAMEYVEGTPLGSTPLPVERVIAAAVQVADALDAAHRQSIVHRDLKTANIMLTARGDVKILDFGIARRVDRQDGAATTVLRVSEAGAVIGTAGYMSPEQALGQEADQRSDLFSFGVVLYELLTGRRPFDRPTSAAELDAVLHDAPPPIPRFNDAVPDPLVAIVGKLLEKDRDMRYQSAREVYNDLVRLQRSTGPITDRAGLPVRRRVLSPAAIVVLSVAVVVTAATGFWWRGRSAASAASPSIVVLPAEISGPQATAGYEYLKDAVPATLSTRLSTIEGIETKVPPTTLEWEAARRDVQQVVRAYAVRYYLSPHVYAEQDRLALTLQLVQADTRRMIWSHDYSGTAAGYQTLIGNAAEDLRGVLRPSAPHAIEAGTRASDSELAFQEGHHYWDRYNSLHQPADFDRAHAALQRALVLDPRNADAAAELAFLYEFKFEGGTPVAEVMPEMRRWTDQALRIDPHNGVALVALADMELLKPDADRSIMLHNALKGAFYAPRAPIVHNLLGVALGSASLSLRIVAQEQSYELDPLYRAVINNLANAYYTQNRSADAVALVETAIARQPALTSLRGTTIEALIDLNRLDAAQAIVDEIKGRMPPAGLLLRQYELLEARGDPGAGVPLSAATAALQDPSLTVYAYVSGAIRFFPLAAKYGRIDNVIQVLQAGETLHHVTPPYDQLVGDERLVRLRQDARFAAILERARANLTATLAVLEEARQNGELPTYLVRPLSDLRARLGM